MQHSKNSAHRSELGLGCVKTCCKGLTDRYLGEFGRTSSFWDFALAAGHLRGYGPSSASCIAGEKVDEGNYALIATKSGWTPMMFMTRVRL